MMTTTKTRTTLETTPIDVLHLHYIRSDDIQYIAINSINSIKIK